VIKEACEQIKEFNSIRFKSSAQIQEYFQKREATKKKLRISFNSIEEIEQLRQSDDFKINLRNHLGVKNEDDWILNLNIGNVMNMATFKFDELNNQLILEDLESRSA